MMLSFVRFILCFLLICSTSSDNTDVNETSNSIKEASTATFTSADDDDGVSGDSILGRSSNILTCTDKCQDGYHCQKLQSVFVCAPLDCDFVHCSGNGYCIGISSGVEFGCVCNNGYTGGDCSVWDRCLISPSPCNEGLECKMDGLRVVCYAAIDEVCSGDICSNGGTCVEHIDGFGCECPIGFEGDFCESVSVVDSEVNSDEVKPATDKGVTGFDRCLIPPNPCEDDLQCKYENGHVICYSDLTSFCDDITCTDRGTCIEDQSGYRCVCRPGFEGKDCQIISRVISSPCNPNPCRGDCDCQESCQHEHGYFCQSRGGFMGKNCTIPVPKVACGQRSISVDIPQALYTEFDKGMRNTYIYLSQDSKSKSTECEAVNVGGSFRVQVPLPFSSCGSISLKSGNALFVKNRVFINRRSTVFSMAIPIVDFECTYDQQYTLVTSLKPVISQPNIINDVGRFEPVVGLCKVGSCPAACPDNLQVRDGALYTVGEMIHISSTVLPRDHFDDYVTSIVSMRLSCSSEQTNDGLSLIENGCRSESGLSSTFSIARLSCVAFQTPRSLGCKSVYIHMDMRMCSVTELETCGTGSEMQRCNPGRERRSIGKSTQTDGYVIVGPLIFINGSEGSNKMLLYPDATALGKSIVYTDDRKKVVKTGESTTVSDDLIDSTMMLLIVIPLALLICLIVLTKLVCGSSPSTFMRKPLFQSSKSNISSASSSNDSICEVFENSATYSGDLALTEVETISRVTCKNVDSLNRQSI